MTKHFSISTHQKNKKMLKGADYFLKSSSFHVTKKVQNSGINVQYQQRWSFAGTASVYLNEVVLTDGCAVP
jgi:hypothetical protein